MSHRKPWTTTEETYLIQTNGRLSAPTQARQLGRSLASIYQRRETLRRAGRLVSTRPRWTPDEDAELVALVEEGLSTPTIARRLKRSATAIVCHLRELGTPIGELRRAGPIRSYSARGVARLLGTTAERVMAWIARGDLTADKNRGQLANRTKTRRIERQWLRLRATGQPRRYAKRTAWHLVADHAIMDFLSDRNCWMLVDPDGIPDPEWRAFALDVRTEAGGEWWDARRLAQHLIVSPKTAGWYISRGDWPGAIKRYGEWYVWSATVLAADAARRAA